MRKGNREEGQQLSRRIHTRLTQEKYDELSGVLKRSIGVRSLSELLRNILENKPIAVRNENMAVDHLMQEMASIRRELQGIGNNINQITHRFHIEDALEGKLYQALEVTKFYQQTDLKVTALFSLMEKISEQWWPKS